MVQIDKKISIIIPCFNEEKNILSAYQRIKAVLQECCKDCEIIFVDNGATDNQLALMKQVYIEDKKHVRVVSLSRNFGYQMSMSAGLEFASGDAVIIIDADLQDPPDLIKEFIEKNKGYIWAESIQGEGSTFYIKLPIPI